MARILLIEDDTAVAQVVADYLRGENYFVEQVTDGTGGLQMARQSPGDLIVLDLGLPELSGIEILKTIRSEGSTVPVLVLTGRDTVEEITQGLDLGADDYLTKPFHVKELGSRVRALLRRAAGIASDILKHAYVSLDPIEHRVTVGDKEVSLLPQEFALLEFILRNPNRVLSPETLLSRVWKAQVDAGPETLRTCMARLRKQIELPGEDSIIETVYGVGYRLRRFSGKNA